MSIKNQLRQPGRKKQIDGHGMTAPERYAPDTRHMVILNVIKSYDGHKPGGRVRQFLTDEGYNEVMQTDAQGNQPCVTKRGTRPRADTNMNIDR